MTRTPQILHAAGRFDHSFSRAPGAAMCACLLAAPVLAANLPPVANPGGPYLGSHNSPISLDGSASSDSNGDPLQYSWDLNGDGGFGDSNLVRPRVSFSTPGTFSIGLQVSDPFGASNLSFTTAAIGNHAPQASAGGPYLIRLGNGFVMDASGSLGVDSDALSFGWDLNNDGSFNDRSGATPSLSAAASIARFGTPGTHIIGVQVTDAYGASSVKFTTLDVAAVPEPATVAMWLAGLLAVGAAAGRRQRQA